MKIIYYITGLGLGHASRAVAITRELQKKNVAVIIRNNDPYSFFKRSLPNVKIVEGQTDFIPILNKDNGMIIDNDRTRQSIEKWIQNMPKTIEKESDFMQREKPDLVLSDISIMPLLVSQKNHIKSVAISNFVWSETLDLGEKQLEFFTEAYRQADLVIKLPFGSTMNFPNKKEQGLVARKVTEQRDVIKNQLGIPQEKKLVTVSLGGIEKISFEQSKDVEILDISDYAKIMKLKKKVNFVEGQNIINSSDLVICKCGYGFVSECLSCGTRFRYVLEPAHKEAAYIHADLEKIGLHNRIALDELKNLTINEQFIENADFRKMNVNTDDVVKTMLNL